MSLTDILSDGLFIAGLAGFAYCAYRLAKEHIIPGAEKLDKTYGKEVDKYDCRIDGK